MADILEYHAAMNDLAGKIKEASARCSELYEPWHDACRELRRLERARSDVWNKLVQAENEQLRAKLQQIATICSDNDIDTSDYRMALRFIRDVAAR